MYRITEFFDGSWLNMQNNILYWEQSFFEKLWDICKIHPQKFFFWNRSLIFLILHLYYGMMHGWWNGRHEGFRFLCRKACGFESLAVHHFWTQKHFLKCFFYIDFVYKFVCKFSKQKNRSTEKYGTPENGVYWVYGGIFGYYRPISQKK